MKEISENNTKLCLQRCKVLHSVKIIDVVFMDLERNNFVVNELLIVDYYFEIELIEEKKWDNKQLEIG